MGDVHISRLSLLCHQECIGLVWLHDNIRSQGNSRRACASTLHSGPDLPSELYISFSLVKWRWLQQPSSHALILASSLLSAPLLPDKSRAS